ncbi:MAG: hypothetical protein A2315_09320 [Ignavibacteria bacterium RIFOXYB2_FULL_35_12]|nr:MAG: hypothetical protein A2006_08155 [Ignavibacteria bacterium GWC2_35_8]OGU62489.1 MAG: hypothetical protein A2X60_17845 [Ignavibacteria bacterium GWF2_35_20]OGU81723.1 MAG: hypothetical protein A2254_11260 [Ignavibacteria bacterium RIFOXYA2_FULL_35_9]OGU86670.1 MAG: hypothetical protein A3K31_05535 [Ignavibacteria bacterium RIFOXYA12_FULL_35_25]OGU87977.1 MAG: hypothetical protein A2492_13400 [Ignavibacteria bacterium RIFOXYC12_FULL_35_11]OGU99876.1 MAG: hypothetical protein A2455_11185 
MLAPIIFINIVAFPFVYETEVGANMLLSHSTGIFNWYKYRIIPRPLEGFNNKFKVLRRKAYGYRDNYFFKLKINTLDETRHALL